MQIHVRRFLVILRLPTLLAASFITTASAAELAAGTLAGRVSNVATGAYLEGAQVAVQPGNVSVFTARDGTFVIPRLPPGDYRLSVSYTGLDAREISVRVSPGEVSVHDVGLSAAIYTLSSFVVEGEREGNALAITQQRNATNVKNVMSSDAFGNVADMNIANFLQRIPGFSTEMFEGEVTRVQIRGTPAGLNAISVDGTRTANGTTRTFERGADIDRLSADFIETIEVTKAMTPDLDADSIGGSVNLKSKSAFDRKGRRVTYNFGQNFNDNSTVGAIATRDLASWDEISGAQINFRRPLALSMPVVLKTGARYRDQTRSRDEQYNQFAYVGPNGIAGPVGGANDDKRFYDSGYVYNPNDKSPPKHAGLPTRFMKLSALKEEMLRAPQLFNENPLVAARDSLINDAITSESVTAAYLMAEVRLFGRMDVVGGVRAEETRLGGDGYKQEISPAERVHARAIVPVRPS